MIKPLNIILGTSSLIRQQLFSRLQLPFKVVHPDIDETPKVNETADELVSRLAKAKAEKIMMQYSDAVIITCDQVIVVDHLILGKPKDHHDAVQQLELCSANKATSLTAVCLVHSLEQRWLQTIEYYYVYFRQLTTVNIENYLKKDKPYRCAGSIKAEGLGSALFQKMQGNDPTALLGLPLIRLVEMLEEINIKVI